MLNHVLSVSPLCIWLCKQSFSLHNYILMSRSTCSRTLEYIAQDAPIIIHFKVEDHMLSSLLNDTHYKNLFETGASNGNPHKKARRIWEVSNITRCLNIGLLHPPNSLTVIHYLSPCFHVNRTASLVAVTVMPRIMSAPNMAYSIQVRRV